MTKFDPYKHEERFLEWKKRASEGIHEVSKENSDIILRYLNDMEKGLNIASESVKGSRSFIRLNTLKDRLIFFSKKFKEVYQIDNITKIDEDQLITFFAEMKKGNLKKANGMNYSSVETYSKIFKAFWHWHQKVNRKKGIEIKDITLDLDTKQEKPDWVYLTEDEVKKLFENAKPEYKALIMFLFDTGIRAPTELMNVKVSDLYEDCKELNIREETSKTFGRRIKLMICSQLIRDHIKENGLKPDDFLFKLSPSGFNQYLKRLAFKIFGDKVSPAGQKYSELTMYDFRHVSCCYWLPRYKSESILKYRFGWKKPDKIHYYSEMLGMRDTISEDDMLIDVTRTELEKSLEKTNKKCDFQQDRINNLESQNKQILELVNQLRREYAQLKEENIQNKRKPTFEVIRVEE